MEPHRAAADMVMLLVEHREPYQTAADWAMLLVEHMESCIVDRRLAVVADWFLQLEPDTSSQLLPARKKITDKLISIEGVASDMGQK